MDTDAIQKRIDAMPARMNAKGLIDPTAEFVLAANGSGRVALRWYNTQADQRAYLGSSKWLREGAIADWLDAADAFIAALPSAEEVKFNEFMGALGCVIDLGKTNGIEVAFLNPLVATMKKLSENALTDQRRKKLVPA